MEQLKGCWWPDRATMEHIREALAPLYGCGSCIKRGRVPECEGKSKVERAWRAARQSQQEE